MIQGTGSVKIKERSFDWQTKRWRDIYAGYHFRCVCQQWMAK